MPKDTMPPCAVPKESRREARAERLADEARLNKDGTPDLRPQNAREIGKLGGIAKGTELPKRTFEGVTEELIDATAASVIEKGTVNVRNSPKLGPVTGADRRVIARLSGIPAEEFVARVSAKLESVTEQVIERVREKLDIDAYKPAELTFLLAVSLDKHARLTGRTQLANASVNIQVNNYGETTNKDDLIRSILGQTKGDADLSNES